MDEKTKVIFYDTETTGIKAGTDQIIELAAYAPFTDETFNELINPMQPIPKEATAIHNISNEMVKDKPSFEEIGGKFTEYCSENALLIAHNNDNFDIHFLKASYLKFNLKFPDWKYLDTLKWARRYRSDLPKHSLQFLRTHYGFEENNAHRALDDVIILYKVFMAMIDDLSFHQAYSLLENAKFVRTMPFGKYRGKPLTTVPSDYVQWLSKSGAFDKKENLDLKSSFENFGLLKTTR